MLDDYSRYILAWRLASTMAAKDVQETLDQAITRTNLTHIKVRHRPRLLSDNGPGFIAEELKSYLQRYRLQHIRSAPYHPMTQGKIGERFTKSPTGTMKNIIKLDNYYLPWHLEQALSQFIRYYNHERYHESLGKKRVSSPHAPTCTMAGRHRFNPGANASKKSRGGSAAD